MIIKILKIFILFFFLSNICFSNINNDPCNDADYSKIPISFSTSPDGTKIAIIYKKHACKDNTCHDYNELTVKSKHDEIKFYFHAGRVSNIEWSPNSKLISFYIVGTSGENLGYVTNYVFNPERTPAIKRPIIIQTAKFGEDVHALDDFNFKWLDESNIVINKSGKFCLINANTFEKKCYENNFLFSSVKYFDITKDGENIFYIEQSQNDNKKRLMKLDLKNGIRSMVSIKSNAELDGILISPDQKFIAISTGNEKSRLAIENYFDKKICILDIAKNYKERCFPFSWNGSPILVGWSSDSKSLFVSDRYKTWGDFLYKISIKNYAKREAIISSKNTGTNNYNYQITTGENNSHQKILFIGSKNISQAPQIFETSLNSDKVTKVTSSEEINEVYESKLVHWRSSDGKEIEGILLFKPPLKGPRPLLTVLHGGPVGTSAQVYYPLLGNSYFSYPLSQGVVIFLPNVRGSDGYGFPFIKAVYKELGRADLQDMLTGIDYLIDQKIADPNRLAVSGWSYGGYLAMMAIINSDRFKLAIAGAAPSSLLTDKHFGYLYLGVDGDANQRLIDHSVVTHAQKINTPLLLIEGRKDFTIGDRLSNDIYDGLKKRNIPIFVYQFNNLGHGIDNYAESYEACVISNKMLDQYLLNKQSTAAINVLNSSTAKSVNPFLPSYPSLKSTIETTIGNASQNNNN